MDGARFVDRSQAAQDVDADLDAIFRCDSPETDVEDLLPQAALHGLHHHKDLQASCPIVARDPHVKRSYDAFHGRSTEPLHDCGLAQNDLILLRADVVYLGADRKVARPGIQLVHLANLVLEHHLWLLEEVEPTGGPKRLLVLGVDVSLHRRHAQSGLAHGCGQVVARACATQPLCRPARAGDTELCGCQCIDARHDLANQEWNHSCKAEATL
mmetsp:Transcript_58127/g.168755  ORF Transcript_58127/g.168755 Transcript_58127/m.168755 type:complete len:213 (+) Transcript_58127:738-1376(+)